MIITKQFADSGIPLLMTGAQASQLYVEPAGDAAEGVTMTSSIAVPGRELPAGPLKDRRRRVHRTRGWRRRTPTRRSSPSTAPPASSCSSAAIEKAGSTDREKVRDALESLDVLTPTGRFTFSEDDHAGLGHRRGRDRRGQDGDLKATPYSLERFETDLPE